MDLNRMTELTAEQIVKSYTKVSLEVAQECLLFAKTMEIKKIIKIHDLCNLINKNNGWDLFTNIRAKVTHSNDFSHKGIMPLAYKIVCEIMKIKSGMGSSVISCDSW